MGTMVDVTAREANQQFSKLLQRAEAGDTVVITKRGRPVAKLVPIPAPEVLVERRKHAEELIEHLERGALHGGKVVDWSRDELYDREKDRW
jgi:prevent-host-death family protein